MKAERKQMPSRYDIGRSGQVVRIFQLVLLIAQRGRRICELSKHFNVTPRTIRRDISAIERAGVPVYVETTLDGDRRWRVDSHFLRRFQ